MKTGRRKIYWDNTCWLAWLNGEGTELWPADVVQGITDVAAEVDANKLILITSAITRGEIFQGRLTQQQRDALPRLMRRKNIREIGADSRIMDKAAAIREYYANHPPTRRIYTPDAIHLATAILYEADEFHTMDGLKKGGENKRKLIALSGDKGVDGLKIVPPYPLHRPPAELIVVTGPLVTGVPTETFRPSKRKATDEDGPKRERS